MIANIAADIPPVLIQKQTAERLGVSIRTLNNWKRRGHGPRPTNFGGVLVYDAAAVEAYARGVR